MTFEEIRNAVNSAWRDHVVNGVPATGPNEPVKQEIRAALLKMTVAMENGGFSAPPNWAADLADVQSKLDDVDAVVAGLGTVSAKALEAQAAASAAVAARDDAVAIYGSIEAVEAAAATATDAIDQMLEIASGAPDAPSILNKVNRNGSNVEADAFRGAIGSFPTRAAAIASRIGESDVDAIRLDGYSAPGDGAALYKRVAIEPAHPGKFQSAGGQWWELGEPSINVRMFGAVGDGVADDTDAIHAAFDFVLAKGGGRVHVPVGKYRVTRGYTHSKPYADLNLTGDTSSREDVGSAQGSTIILDNPDAASFFFKNTKNQHLQVSDIAFKCAQYALDRPFFDFSSGLLAVTIDNVNFEKVEQPFVFRAGLIMQSGSFRNIQFRNSGTFHSKTTGQLASDIDTFMTFDGINHEGSVPANSEKIVCNLSGIRMVLGREFLLEGSLPGPGYTILKLENAYNVGWIRAPQASFYGYYSEWNGPNRPDADVVQVGGRTLFQNAVFNTGKIQLSNRAVLTVEDSTFSAGENLNNQFEFLDDFSHVNISRCVTRLVDLQDTRFSFHNINLARDGSSEVFGSCYISPGRGAVAYRWDGGLLDTVNKVSVYGQAGYYVSADGGYGRKVVFPSTDQTTINASLLVNWPDEIKKGQQIYFAGLVRVPTMLTGQISCYASVGGVAVGAAVNFRAADSGKVVPFVFATRVLNDVPINRAGLQIGPGGITGMSGAFEILALEAGTGEIIPTFVHPDYPTNTVSFGSAAPTQGEWRRGDRVHNRAPAVGSPTGWICTVAGTPGTWVSMGNLA